MRWTWDDVLYALAVGAFLLFAVYQAVQFHAVRAAGGCGL